MVKINQNNITSTLKIFILALISMHSLTACSNGASSYSSDNTPQTPITLSLVPSRITGVAPLSVFFDASGTTATATATPFHDLEYRWNFGDTTSGTWAYGAKPGTSSKNLATGPEAAHVFETPGTYTVTLTAFDGTNTASTTTIITVSDPNTVFNGAKTICFSTGTDFTGCPSIGITGANQTVSDFSSAINTYAASNKRLLFRRGDTFVSAASANITVTGPGTIGAFGTGALPIVQGAGGGNIINLSNQGTPTIADWRVMDLTLDGLSGSNTIGVFGNGGIDQVTLLRLTIQNVHIGLSFSPSVLSSDNFYGVSGHRLWDQLTLADSTIMNIVAGSGGGSMGVSGSHFAILGNSLNNALGGEGTSRYYLVDKGVISNNTLSGQAPTKELIKMHAPTWCNNTITPGCNYTNDSIPTDPVNNDGGRTFGYTEKIVISDNKLVSAANAPWMVTIGPQNGQSDERVRDVIFERNWMVAATNTQTALLVMARNITVRNNICDLSPATSAGGSCYSIGVWGIEPPSDAVNVFNNTAYSSTTAVLRVVALNAATTNITVKNNLGYGPSNSGSVMFNGTSGTGFVASNNSSDAQVYGTSPNFSLPTPVNPADFKINTTSYAISGGTLVPVWSDFFLVSQTATSSRDMGAVNH